MTISVRMDPLLERELELAAKRQGVTKTQFVIAAVERALGRRNPYELMMTLKAEEEHAEDRLTKKFEGEEQPYDTEGSRKALVKKLSEKHSVRRTG